MQTADYTDAMSSPCPRRTCGARPGEPCRDRSGQPKSRVHSQRGRPVNAYLLTHMELRAEIELLRQYVPLPDQAVVDAELAARRARGDFE